MSDKPVKDQQTVTPAGEPTRPLPHGVLIGRAITHVDERGTLCEISNPTLAIHNHPLVYVYQITVRPGKVKGWHVHRLHDDRIFISKGTVKVVLYDDRPESPTYQMLSEVYRSELDRNVMTIPAGVFHAHQNVAAEEAILISLPTRPYDHADPDVYRLPLENDRIPYRFKQKIGW